MAEGWYSALNSDILSALVSKWHTSIDS